MLDSNALLFWSAGAAELTPTARHAMSQTDITIFVSVVTPWELAIKYTRGRLDCGPLLSRFPEYLHEQGFVSLDINVDHAIRAGSLPIHHRDPFDRMLVAQAQAESLWIVSSDGIFEHYGVRRIW